MTGLRDSRRITSRQLQRLTMSSKTPMYTAFTSSLNGLVTIRAFQAERLFKTACAHHLDRAQAPMYYRYAGIRFLRTALNLLTALIAIAITPPQPDPQRSQKLALASVVVTLLAILTAMASSSAEGDTVATAADQRLDKSIKLSAFGMTLVALVLFIIAIATIQGA